MPWAFYPINKSNILNHFFWVGLIIILIGCKSGFGPTPSNSLPRQEIESPLAHTDEPVPVTATPDIVDHANDNNSSPVINPYDGAEVVFVPAGVFEMGADAVRSIEICVLYRDGCDLGDFADEEPVHPVELDAFWIYRYEVTNENYQLCVQAGGCNLPAFNDFYNNPDYADHPVVYVSWGAAAEYCEWAGGRLPTEAEWEKAARGSDGRIFPWGEEEADCGHANLSGCSFEMTAPAGSLPSGASPFGVMDMAGNVSEWVADWYSPRYYFNSPGENPPGPETGEVKVIRGGSWKNPGVGLRSTNRGANFPEVFSTGVGFRCVLDYN